ncbi:hypothetical protein D5018_01205 [Parashewanella curva]|uniref:DUF6475 domain-containing protein n=1 Tax=Parashewanella curva TaxID=2338552 RepID=A0A3L8Q2G6_9GAMM|nr:hypothetical protein D5018_01205 [Parashewanella curva]
MIESDKIEFAQIWASAWNLYRQKISTQILTIAFEALKNYSIEEIRTGMTHHIRSPDTGQFCPTPTDIIKHIDGNSISKSLLAWNKVDEAIKRVGAWSSVIFDDPLIHRVITDMGGWVKLCKIQESDYPYKMNLNKSVALHPQYPVARSELDHSVLS